MPNQPNNIRVDVGVANLSSVAPGPTSPQHEKEAARAISKTDSWKPSLGRKQSYYSEDRKHALQMSGVQDVEVGPGFSER
ncbi:uncharacterized protein F4812DRAFT_260161 [Daldinia caldariorum]|uniref:uncharacterized protein n=1 Tax=Daldinia caldariorum TaxID=326644 RepID=UPI002007389F|nr:uncharacterized protein F4812DRAFT_260161 [Daldinia caldariorum]KAI1470293.1 hypothetical protein F4812DRAFT_260161 [Daldinia caldariorum]